MRISDWSSDVCSSDLTHMSVEIPNRTSVEMPARRRRRSRSVPIKAALTDLVISASSPTGVNPSRRALPGWSGRKVDPSSIESWRTWKRSEEHTSELQSLMRISYAVFCLKKKKKKQRLAQYTLYDYTHYDKQYTTNIS